MTKRYDESLFTLLSRLLSLVLPLLVISPVVAQSVLQVKPEQVGLSTERLQKVHDVVQQHIDSEDIPGAIILVSRDGKIAYWQAQGVMDEKNARTPLQNDTVFWVVSMTKPYVATSVMMMMEAGKLSLDDPVSRFIPEFKAPARVRVLKPGSPPLPQGQTEPNAPKPQYDFVPANRAITVRDLLTHTSGLQSIGVPNDPSYPPPLQTGETLAVRVPKFAQVPLDFQPGTKWAYSNGTGFDVLARIVEVASGQPFGPFVQQHIFDPLGMKDASFGPRNDLASRTLWINPARLQQADMTNLTYYSGGAGIWMPIADYWRFAQMLLNKGEFDGKRLLKAKTVEQMSSAHVADPMPYFDNCCIFPGFGGLPDHGVGFGYSMEIVTDHDAAKLALPDGSFGWNGQGQRQFWVIPRDKMVLIMFIPSGKASLVHRDVESAVMQAVLH